jgi:hypothetical protein
MTIEQANARNGEYAAQDWSRSPHEEYMKNDILKAGLVILGVYFLVNGNLGLMSGCIQ